MSRPQLFFISGLGADHRAFDRIDIEGYEQRHLPWLVPDRKESFQSYVRRMAEPIHEAENPVVIGLSLGGMMASEMTTFIPHMKAILVSSIKAPEERSVLLKIGRVFPAQQLVSGNALKRMSFLWTMAKRKYPKDEVDHMIRMFREQDERFLKWAIVNAPKWKGRGDIERISHIHGTADQMFPVKRINGYIPVEGGSHLMVYTRGKEVTELLLQELKRIEGV
ncbi:MAG: alpha/beta hydrolase [Bacteroidetes bacterium]|nr:MAG: alpha/beta hydrolase [Bacteroidota bacterium]